MEDIEQGETSQPVPEVPDVGTSEGGTDGQAALMANWGF